MLLVSVNTGVSSVEIELDTLPELEIISHRKILSFDDGRIFQTQDTDPEGKVISRDQSTYSSEGFLVGQEEYFDDGPVPSITSATTYSKDGRKLRELRYSMGELERETVYTYFPSGMLESKTRILVEGTKCEKRFTYSQEFPDKEIKVEFFENGKLVRTVLNEWQLKKGKPELVREDHLYELDETLSRVYCYYDSEETENGLATEIYNSRGEYMEEMRERIEKGQTVFQGWYLSADAESAPYKYSTWKYDEAGNLIYSEDVTENRIAFIFMYSYDHQNRLLRKIYISRGKGAYEASFESYGYEETADDFRLF